MQQEDELTYTFFSTINCNETLIIDNIMSVYRHFVFAEYGKRQTLRSVGLRLSYQFGSGKRSEVKRNRNLKTDDLDISTGVD